MILNINEVNEVVERSLSTLISGVDAAYRKRVYSAGEEIIKNRRERPIITLSGPSGSGKTTTALILEKFLDDAGYETHTLSLDNYFKSLTPEEMVLAERGELDLETPKRIDADFLNSQLTDIYECRPVKLEEYNFKQSRREATGETLTRKPDELIIMEGIHALNPEVISIPEHETYRMYISIRTTVEAEGASLAPGVIRLLRRLIRDRQFRKRDFTKTIEMFDDVECGERLYIAPYQERANMSFDTFMPYELGVYKMIEHELEGVRGLHPEIDNLIKVLGKTAAVPAEAVPADSLVREYIGGSAFSY